MDSRSPDPSTSAPLRKEAPRTPAFVMEIRDAAGSALLGSERVRPGDLAGLRAEALWRGATRRGRPEDTVEDGVRGPFPTHVTADGRGCGGVAFRVGADPARSVEVTFTRDSFLPVVRRAVARLVSTEVLRVGDEYVYALVQEPDRDPDAPPPPAHPAVRAAAPLRSARPAFGSRSLARILAAARAVDAEFAVAADHAVVLSNAVLERARAVAERGIAHTPPIETGGILVGTLQSCPESGEAFVLVEEALEARHTLAKEFSLEFSGETWRAFEAVLQRRRAHPASAGQLLVGQFHGHPFVPDAGLAPCAECATRAVCSRSSARPSADDARWCRAVFADAPWQLSLMLGLDARGERRLELYGQRAGSLARRGYHVVESLERLPLALAAPAGRDDEVPRPPRSPSGDSPCPTT